MKKTNKMTPKAIVLVLALAILVGLCATGCSAGGIKEILAQDSYTYVNPDETLAETDAGFVIDGVLDEEAYQNNNWLYLSNKDGGANVEIAMTSYFGEKGMYFVYDVTEGNPIYVNLDRAPYLNSCVEMYLAPSTVNNMKGNSVFEIDLLPTGDMTFKKSNGKGQFVNVATTKDKMAVLGATTKGGELNTEDCYGYCLELFIPWEFMDKFDLNAEGMKDGYVYVDPAHITSFNYAGTNMDVDRYWYFFAQENGASWNNVYQYFRFDGKGVQGTVPVEMQAGEHCTVEGTPSVIPGMKTNVTVTPDAGYALKSILINGEEHIQEANFNEDGSVTVNVRGVAGGMKISAAAEPVTEGNKTLQGTVTVNKMGGDKLKNISASYKGPTGEKPLELDKNGKFTLTDLKQGLYTIVLEKSGYQKLTRSIYVNRDMEVVLHLEYDLFEATNYGWILDDQNEGILYKFGGDGQLLTRDSYESFTVSATFKYDKELEKVGDFDSFKEQRQGYKIAFDNGKIWHIDLLKQDGKYYVQYAKHSGNDSLTGWNKVYQLDKEEVARYTGEKGVKLTVLRSGKYANVYLDGKLVAQEIFDNVFLHNKAQIGFEAWNANREVMEIPFAIYKGTNVNLHNTYFKMKDGWDVSQQYNGVIAKTEDGGKRLTFIEKYENIDLTVTARDYQNSSDQGKKWPRTDILFEFDNGKQMSFGITTDGKTAKVQSMYDAAAADKYVNTGWQSWGNLTAEELALLESGGVEFRVVRYGTEVTLYIGDRMVAVADLTANKSGITAETPAKVNIRHYDDDGVRVEIPFEVTTEFDLVDVTTGNNLTAEKQQYFAGDTVKITAKDDGNYISSLKVNGKDVTVDFDGTYSFEATEKAYNVTGTVAKSIFKPDSQWDILEQNTNVISIPERVGSYASIYTSDSTYRDASILVQDLNPTKDSAGKGNYQMQIRFILANDKEYQIRLHNTNKVDTYEIQSMGGTNCITGWKWHVNLTAEQTAKLRAEGVEFRVAMVGTDARMYIDDVEVAIYSLASGGVTANTTAQIRFMTYGNTGVKNLEMPFELGGAPKTATVTVASGIENGKITTGKKDNVAIAGEKITVTATPNAGYNLNALTVKKDGKAVDLGDVSVSGGSYTFTVEEGKYVIDGEFTPRIFLDTEYFDLKQQHNGYVTLKKGSTSARTLKTESNIYREMAVTVREQEQGTFKTEFHFTFTNGKQLQLRLHNENTNGEYRVQNMKASIVNAWKNVYTLNADQVAKLKSAQGMEFRVAIVGTYAFVYLDGVEVGMLDLSAGISKETAQIAVVFYGNNGVENIKIPYELGMGAAASTVQVASGIANGTVTASKAVCVAGETVTVTATPNEGYNLTSLTVTKDGAAVNIGKIDLAGGTYSFVAQEGSYSVSAVFASKLFADTEYFDLTNQYNGSVTLLKGSTSARTLKSVANTYRDVSVTVRDQESGTFKTEFHFTFTNGKKFQIRLDNEAGYYRVQNMGGSSMIVTGWTKVHTLTDAEIAQLKSASGLNYRVSISGTNAIVYLGGVEVGRLDLSAGITTETAQISVVFYGNNGVENIQIPYTLSSGPATATIQTAASANGTVTLDKTVCAAGETVTVTAAPAEGYNMTGLTVKKDGVVVKTFTTPFAGGTFTFETEGGSYTVEGQFAKPLFYIGTGSNDIDDSWSFAQQYNGILGVTRGGTYARLYTTEKSYRSVSVTVKDLTPTLASSGKGNFKMQVYFDFGSAGQFQIRLHNENADSKYKVQKMGNDFSSGWSTWYTLTDAEVDQLQNGSGVNFRVALEGSKAVAYINGAKVGEIDLSGKVDASATAQIILIMYGNDGQAFEIPFTLG